MTRHPHLEELQRDTGVDFEHLCENPEALCRVCRRQLDESFERLNERVEAARILGADHLPTDD